MTPPLKLILVGLTLAIIAAACEMTLEPVDRTMLACFAGFVVGDLLSRVGRTK